MNYLHFLWLRVGLGSTPGVGLSCTWVSMASAHDWAWIQGKTPGRWPSTTHTKVLVTLSPPFFFFFLQLHPFSQDVLITWNCQVLTPQDLVQKASPLWIPSSLLTLSTPCLILFSLHISLWVAFKLLAKWALASSEPSTAPAQPKIWIHIWW